MNNMYMLQAYFGNNRNYRETPPESLLNATRSVSNKMVLNLNRSVEKKLLLFYCLDYLINIVSMTTKMCS
jgi:hypothetical protein